MSLRSLRVAAGIVAALAGAAAVAIGAVAGFWIVGPDDVLSAEPRKVDSGGVAITSPPDLVDYYDSRAVITVAPAPADRDVFVGVGHHIDVRSYLDKRAQTRFTEVRYPSTVETSEIKGATTRVLPPTELDWWTAHVSGRGTQTLEWTLADGPYDLVIMGADGAPGLAATVTFGLELKGAFASSLAVMAAGVTLLAGAGLLFRSLRTDSGIADDVLWEDREAWESNGFWGSPERPGAAPAPLPPPGHPAAVGQVVAADPYQNQAAGGGVPAHSQTSAQGPAPYGVPGPPAGHGHRPVGPDQLGRGGAPGGPPGQRPGQQQGQQQGQPVGPTAGAPGGSTARDPGWPPAPMREAPGHGRSDRPDLWSPSVGPPGAPPVGRTGFSEASSRQPWRPPPAGPSAHTTPSAPVTNGTGWSHGPGAPGPPAAPGRPPQRDRPAAAPIPDLSEFPSFEPDLSDFPSYPGDAGGRRPASPTDRTYDEERTAIDALLHGDTDRAEGR